jgi:type II secretory ATPase GspE/PulE/Tfp pilus assembly ATPase PilB-like protein
MPVDRLGLSPDNLARLKHAVERPYGMVLCVGPTGSGKTTTLYAALARVNGPGVKVVTVEDPVEYQMEGVTQIPVNRKAGVGFASALRSILRHDPDIIMVGEMRDKETAEIAIQAALTGHRVFSTLHTNDAVAGVTRLVDMGIEPYLVAATVSGIVAQRLVRVVCEKCKGAGNGEQGTEPLYRDDRDSSPSRPAAASLGMTTSLGHSEPSGEESSSSRQRGTVPGSPFPVSRSRCTSCSGTGYRGRTGIYELFTVDEEIRRLVAERASLDALRAVAKARGMSTLRDDGMAKVGLGITTIEEVLRVTSDEDPA